MTLNYDAPAKVITRYSASDGITHTCSFHVIPQPGGELEWDKVGEDLDYYPILTRGDIDGKTVQDAVTEFWHGQGGILAPDGMRSIFHSDTQFISVEVVKYAPLTNTPSWVTERDFDYQGTSLIAENLNSQHIWTGKSTEGGMAKLSFLDVGSSNASVLVPRGGFNANQNQMAWCLTHPNSLIACKDGGFWSVIRGYYGGQNEAVFKRRNRS